MLFRHFKPALFVSSAVLMGVMLSQCGGKSEKASGTQMADMSYEAAVTFTPAAVAKLKSLGQKATVEAYYHGSPLETAKDKVNEAGQIDLGMDMTDIDASTQTVKLSGKGIDPEVLSTATDGKPSVTLRVYSSPTAGTANQLKCTEFNGTVEAAKAAPIAITCDAA
ncbi:hypothetical protein AEAC466_12500 [Asticcacaulis sp. AC466]|uniref:hypothetical protein n=1 Tax=Asticcacaulis sp. AC466 TaxID=1282362 RepID=UPI0003C3E185|nr:hypothetical protein [Asticcacaulis sp. AC466]ESQ83489.1 hypothetical protein AEAC466_12500 [Asticcacaulis sp. AC466]